jgi:hypothetical protein
MLKMQKFNREFLILWSDLSLDVTAVQRDSEEIPYRSLLRHSLATKRRRRTPSASLGGKADSSTPVRTLTSFAGRGRPAPRAPKLKA